MSRKRHLQQPYVIDSHKENREMAVESPNKKKFLALGTLLCMFTFTWWRWSVPGPEPLNYIDTTSWNLAAINNNPFEYWIEKDDPAYTVLMQRVSAFVSNAEPSADVLVEEVFSPQMAEELYAQLKKTWPSEAEVVKKRWEDDFKGRRIISEFLKDKELGSKRLASMPDRVTNTMLTADGPRYRPTAINCFQGSLSTTAVWWAQWKRFMFHDTVRPKQGDEAVSVASLLVPIKKSKYPAITEAEERVSVQLQILAVAIFDAIIVHMLNSLSSDWQAIRTEICGALNLRKTDRTLEILQHTYRSSHVFLLQEVGTPFISTARDALSHNFHVLQPGKLSRANQNSVIMLAKERFALEDVQEVTQLVHAKFKQDVPVSDGDILAVLAKDQWTNTPLMLVSFHGDTNGLATIPVVEAVHSVLADLGHAGRRLVFGLDANTYEHAKQGKTQAVLPFVETFQQLGLDSCWASSPFNPSNYTTFNGRTFLQTQLNKALTKAEIRSKGDVNPKDFILFSRGVHSWGTYKDNTGDKVYKEDSVFPTLAFPSDHGLLSTRLFLTSH